MKILFIHPYFHIKTGSGKLMFSEAELLRQNGHEVFFFTTNKSPYYDEDYKYKKYFSRHIDYKSVSLPVLLAKAIRPLYNKESMQKLDLMLKKVEPDVVHVHGTGPHLSDTVLKACHDNDIPVVTTIHGPGFFCPAGTFMKKKQYICDETECLKGNYLKSLIHNCSKRRLHVQLPYLVFYTLNRRVLGYEKYISKFICPSNAIKNIALEAGVAPEMLETVYNMVELPPENLLNSSAKNGDYFLYIGRLDEEKGVHYLIEAMKTLPQDIELHIVGKGAQEAELRLLARGYDNIQFKGFLTGKDLEDEYKNCIASVLPCNWFEAFGLTIAEAFAYAKPVIASNVGGIPEIIEHDVNGILTEPANSNQIAQAILKLDNDRELAVQMGKQGQEKVKNLFSPEAHYKKLIKVYEQVENTVRK